MNCRDIHTWIQQRLDGTWKGEQSIIERHLAECGACRSLAAGVCRLEEGLRVMAPPAPPLGLSSRIVSQVLSERRFRLRFRRRVYAVAAAAAVLLVTILGYNWPKAINISPSAVTTNIPLATHDPLPVPSDSPLATQHSPLTDAGTALAALMERTADKAMSQSRVLLPLTVQAPSLPEAGAWQQPLDPSVRTLIEAGHNVSAGLEPVTTSARRAVSLFLREIPGDNQVKSSK